MGLKSVYTPMISQYVNPVLTTPWNPRILYSTSCSIFLFEMISISQFMWSKHNSCYFPPSTCLSFILSCCHTFVEGILIRRKIFVSLLSLNFIFNSSVSLADSISKTYSEFHPLLSSSILMFWTWFTISCTKDYHGFLTGICFQFSNQPSHSNQMVLLLSISVNS